MRREVSIKFCRGDYQSPAKQRQFIYILRAVDNRPYKGVFLKLSIIKAIFLGLVQGITEFLPISSSGHLSVLQHFLGVGGEGSLLFTVLLHMGTLVAVVLVYWKTLLALLGEAVFTVKDIVTRQFKWREMRPTRRMLFMLILSCVPLLLLLLPVENGLRLMSLLGGLAEDEDIFVEGVCFLFTGGLLLFGVWRAKQQAHPRKQIDEKSALAVGFAQFLAAGFPGISRSGSTVSTGMICGVSKEYMVRYSFILGVPAVLAANVMELKDALADDVKLELLPLLLGIVTAVVVGFFAIKALEWLVKTDKFKYFGYYCLGIGTVVIVAGIVEKLIK